MSNLVNASLDIIRRHHGKSRQPQLHTRWGDVGITAPIEGAWSQIKKPSRQRGRRGETYGPGFVPGIDIESKEVLLLDSYYHSDDNKNLSENEIVPVVVDDIQRRSRSLLREETDAKAIKSKARRLTQILLPSASSSVNSPVKKSVTMTDAVDKGEGNDFHYVLVKPNYAQEVVEQASIKTRPSFRYVPASTHYLPELIPEAGFKDNERKKKNKKKNMGQQRHSHDSEDDADDEHEVTKGVVHRAKRNHQRRKTQEYQRSHSCDPCISPTAEQRPRPRANTVTDEIVYTSIRKTSLPDNMPTNDLLLNSSPDVRVGSTTRKEQDQQSQDSIDQTRGRLYRAHTNPPVAIVQRSKSSLKKLHRRTMTVEMVGTQDDLW